MNQSFDPEIEEVLLRSSARFQQGDTKAVDDIVSALKRVGGQHRNLQPLLSSLLKLDQGDVQIFAACALGRLGAGAKGAVADLMELACAGKVNSSDAAASALGSIPGRESIDALGAVLDSMGQCSLRGIFVYSAIERHAEEATSLLHKLLERRSDELDLDSSSRFALNSCIRAIRSAERFRYQSTIDSLDLHDYVPIAPINGNLTASQVYSKFPAETLGDQHGLRFDGRFRFKIYGVDRISELGLKIYRGARNEDIVVVSHDGRSGPASPTNCAECLATAIVAIYELNAKKLTWVERYTQSSGMVDKDEATVVSFDYDKESGKFSNPQWMQKVQIKRFIREFGVE